jgi:hypothetical protein
MELGKRGALIIKKGDQIVCQQSSGGFKAKNIKNIENGIELDFVKGGRQLVSSGKGYELEPTKMVLEGTIKWTIQRGVLYGDIKMTTLKDHLMRPKISIVFPKLPTNVKTYHSSKMKIVTGDKRMSSVTVGFRDSLKEYMQALVGKKVVVRDLESQKIEISNRIHLKKCVIENRSEKSFVAPDFYGSAKMYRDDMAVELLPVRGEGVKLYHVVSRKRKDTLPIYGVEKAGTTFEMKWMLKF